MSDFEPKYEGFAIELCEALVQRGLSLAAEKRGADSKRQADEYRAGVIWGYYEVISLLKQVAEVHELPLSELKLDTINADRDLL